MDEPAPGQTEPESIVWSKNLRKAGVSGCFALVFMTVVAGAAFLLMDRQDQQLAAAATATATRPAALASPAAPTPTATRAASAGTPTPTRAAGASTPSRTGAAATPTMMPDPTWRPPVLALAKDAPTVAVTDQTLFSDVSLYDYQNRFAYQVMGRSDACATYGTRKGILLRNEAGVPYWQEERFFMPRVTSPEAGFRIAANDPGLKAKVWRTYPGCP